ncbi:MAG: Phosphodiesterase, partial [Actinomycetota bacterium]|nr:Phosphodiesterase [Actinomycetota bacterium]
PDVERWWMLTCTQVCDDAGVELGCITTLAPADDGSADRQRRVLDEAQALAHMGAWELDVPSGELWWSDEVYRIFGLPPQSFTPDYDAFLAAVHPDDRSTVRDAVDRVLVAGSQYAVRHRIVRPNGDVRYVQEKSLVVRESDGSARRLLGTVTDVTEEALADAAQERAQAALASSEARYRMLAENASDVVWQIDRDGVVEWLSDSVRTVLGWQPADIVGHQADEFLHPEDRGRRGDLSQSLAGDKGPQEVRLLRPDGTYRWMSSSVHPTETSEGLALVGALRDIQAEVEARVELEHAIGHDRLTGLATLAATAGRIADRQARLAHGSAVVGVMCIGVDGLGTINDAYAHAAGDRVLAAVARRIVATVGDVDLVGRGAGNEVHVVLPDLASGADAVPLAERIRRAVVDPIHVGEVAVTPSVSIGIAVGGRDDDAGELLRGAGVAMRRAKSNGRDRYEFLDQEMADEAQRLLQLESGIRVGLQRDEFRPWFQPIVNLTTGEVVGHEALVRWLTADGQTVEAWKFLPVAERGHLIADLDLVVLNKAIEELAGDPDSGRFIAVNVSAESLRRGDYDAHVVGALTEWGVPSERLHLEVTETALLNLTGDLRATVATLADAGISWYVDDFGTGYSSISHLRDLPIGGLKLDRSFTSGLAAGDQTCTRLADGLVGLADGLGLDTVAEGVETAAGQAVLASQGWRHGQGWLYGKPAPRR